jgi:hypothetical protein
MAREATVMKIFRSTDLDPVKLGESVWVGWDFSLYPDLVTPDAAVIASVISTSCGVFLGSDPAASTRLGGAVTISGSPQPPDGSGRASTVAAQLFTPGVAGVIYDLTCWARMGDGATMAVEVHVECVA